MSGKYAAGEAPADGVSTKSVIELAGKVAMRPLAFTTWSAWRTMALRLTALYR